MDKSLITISAPVTENTPESAERGERKARENKKSRRFIVLLCAYLVIVPLAVFGCVKLFVAEKYNIVSMIIAVAACLPFFIGFEKGRSGARELTVIAVMTAISVFGRLIFAPFAGFKPVTAIVIITAIGCGPQAGFLTGALSAVVSNIFFGQGPWTPFQMLAWGLTGFLSGLIFRRGKKPRAVPLVIVGIIGGALFSCMTDVWTVLSLDGGWNFDRYLALLLTGLPFTAVYAASNVIFLLLLAGSITEKLNRLRDKYGVFR